MEINPNFSTNAVNDFNLVQQAIVGDQKAYGALMARYRDSIFFMLLKMVNNKEDANDLTIETFAKAFRNLEKYQPTFAFSTWLFKIATNNCIDFLKKKRITTLSIDEHVDDDDDSKRTFDVAGYTPTPEESIIRKQKSALLKNIVEDLPVRYKRLVILRYFEEYSYEEIARELDLPLGTVKAQLLRARDLLYNTLRNSKGNI
ncbi:RNA polymerase sigma factor [Solitalea koreensis]|uniref:RNA polymerase sigma-70 factor, ECF subfamily n=1 Tax=Solitalea koreensis TaxID=543615 RepID=A0A521DAQ9_9SPHI|nr:sigma-70 family RNA polymerase sigma factor [Solitalea koreensis]SMO68161.1 RNA polymerase sigma-70 factor, ECF subfamily [Solitalea koreensis]